MKWLPVIPALLGLVLGSSAPARASELPATQLHSAVERCIESQFKPGEATARGNLVTLSKTCPGLANARGHRLFTHLQPPLGDEVSVSQLLDLRAILQTRTRNLASISTGKYSYADLESLLTETYIPRENVKPAPNLWQQFLQWLREVLTPEDAEPPAWLEKFLKSIELPEADTVTLFLKGAVALLVLLIILLIFNELRAANILSAWRHIRRGRKPLSDQPGFEWQDENLTLDQISNLSDKQFAGRLLVRTLRQLMERRILPFQFSLTNRELLKQLPPEQNALLPDLHHLIDVGEAGLYGDQALDPQQRRQMLHLSEKLVGAEDAA